MILFINTSIQNITTIILSEEKHFYSHTFRSEFHQSEKLLKEIDAFLKKRKKTVQDLQGIVAVIGPGPFTALRIGVIVANTLGYALNIKIVGIKQSEFSSIADLIKKGRARLKKARGFKILLPFYGREPNITIQK